MALTAQSFVRLGFAVCFVGSVGCAARTSTPTALPTRPATSSTVPAPARIEDTPPTPIASRLLQDSSNCQLGSGDGDRITTVALGERVDPGNAPHPTNTSERLLFRQLYETLVRVNCEGFVAPGLAASWRWSGEQGKWIITLRQGARFSDGVPVTAADVVSAWTVEDNAEALRPAPGRLIRSVLAVDERTLEIVLRSRRIDVPTALAHTDLSVAKRQPGSSWPQGTRSSSVNSTEARRDGASVITLTGDNTAVLTRFVVAPGRDGRDFLDDGADLLLTRDARTLSYAATLPQFMAVPLAWQRTEVLLVPGRSRDSNSLSEEARQALAREAVRGEARGAQGPFWWQTPLDCSQEFTPSRPAASTNGRVVYDSGDNAARDLAERLVGLVRASGPRAAVLDALLPGPGRTYQRAAGLTGDALATALRRGDDAAYIVTLERALDPCRETQVLSKEVGWLDPATIVPLVDTRLQAIMRRGRSGVTAEWDGGLLLMDGQK